LPQKPGVRLRQRGGAVVVVVDDVVVLVVEVVLMVLLVVETVVVDVEVVLDVVVAAQLNTTEVAPLIVMGSVELDWISVAEPVTVKLLESGAPGQDPDAVWVSVPAAAVKLMVPGTVIAGPDVGVSVKVKSIVNEAPTSRLIAVTLRVKPLQSAVALATVRSFAKAGFANITSKPSTGATTPRCFLTI
jgi:hypothetical protein